MSYVPAIRRLAADNPNSDYLVQNFWHPNYETHIEPQSELPDDLQHNSVFSLRFPQQNHTINDDPKWSVQNFTSRIGSNGLNYVEGRAEFAVFESDCGHGGNAQTPEQIAENNARLKDDGRVTATRSTGGKGVHYRVRFTEPVPCPDLATYNRLCVYAAEQFGMTDKTCAKGGFLWFYASTANEENQGFALLFEATDTLTVPSDWQQSPPATRVSTGANRAPVVLTEHHNELLDQLTNNGVVVRPHTLEDGSQAIATHTKGLEAAHKALNYLGAFSTISPGSDLQSPNCYIIPNDDGSWRVYRFGSTPEPGWNVRHRDQRSWCWFNQFDESDWGSLCATFQGVNPSGRSKKTYVLPSPAAAASVVAAAGGTFVAPAMIANRPVTLSLGGGQIQAEIARDKGDATPEGWLELSPKKFGCVITLPTTAADRSSLLDVENVKIGYHYAEVGQQHGETLYYVRHDDGTWKPETPCHVGAMLVAQGMPSEAIRTWIGNQIRAPQKISCKPFAKDSDDPYVWNRGYRFACDPVPGKHPTWDKVFNHTFEYLTPYVVDDPWCKANGIKTGYDFGIVYAAQMVQRPASRAASLFFFSKDQGSGKDSYPMSMALLMEEGAVVSANDAVTSSSGFNGELEGKVIYVINEIDLSKSGSTAESRCRDWVTNPILHIHRKGITPYSVVNYGRVIQMANDPSYKLISTEDARTIVIELSKISPDEHLDWDTELKPRLISERAAFLHTLLNYELPEHGAKGSRCYLPILQTEAKLDSIAANLPPLDDKFKSLFEQVLEKAVVGEWQGLIPHSDIVKMLSDVPSNPRTWGSVWNRLTPYLVAHGLNPAHKVRVEHKTPAVWGFA